MSSSGGLGVLVCNLAGGVFSCFGLEFIGLFRDVPLMVVLAVLFHSF